MPLPRVRDAFAHDPEGAMPRWPLAAALAGAVLGVVSIAWLAITDTEPIVDLGDGFAWLP